MLDLYDVGDQQHTQMLATLERCRDGSPLSSRQKHDIDATIAELDEFSGLLDDQTRSEGKRLMPIYTAPVRDTRFVLDHVLEIGRYSNLPGFANATPDLVEAILDGGRAVLRGSASAAQPGRRRGRLQAQRRRVGDDAAGLQGGLGPVRRRRLDDAVARREEYGGQGLPHGRLRPRSPNISARPTTASKCTTA